MDSIMNSVPIPVNMTGFLLERTEDDKLSGIYNVILDSNEATLQAKLSYSPGTNGGFNAGETVNVIVVCRWSVATMKFDDIVYGANHMITGIIDIEKTDTRTINNPNTDLGKTFVSFLNKTSQSGLSIGETGYVKLSTNDQVVHDMAPGGNGLNENLARSYAQNFERTISNNGPDFTAKEHFGLYRGNDVDEKISNASLRSTMPIIYRRFVPKSMDSGVWVSSNEGTYSPYVGSNNNYHKIPSNGSDIIYNKIINYKTDRLTIHAGEAGEGFYTFRIDKVDEMSGEGRTNVGSGAKPVSAKTMFYLGISEEGEINMEAGIVDGKPAMSFNVSKDGEVNLDFGKSFKLNGMEVVTEKFIDFMTSHQADLVQVAALGAPAPMSPSAAPDFVAGKQPDNFLTETASNTVSSSAPTLRST